MIQVTPQMRILLAVKPVDFRKRKMPDACSAQASGIIYIYFSFRT